MRSITCCKSTFTGRCHSCSMTTFLRSFTATHLTTRSATLIFNCKTGCWLVSINWIDRWLSAGKCCALLLFIQYPRNREFDRSMHHRDVDRIESTGKLMTSPRKSAAFIPKSLSWCVFFCGVVGGTATPLQQQSSSQLWYAVALGHGWRSSIGSATLWAFQKHNNINKHLSFLLIFIHLTSDLLSISSMLIYPLNGTRQ